MTNKTLYTPPFTISSYTINKIAEISELIGLAAGTHKYQVTPHLRKTNQIRSIQASLQIENNTLSLEQVTALINGKRILGEPREIKEVQNAFAAYEKIATFKATSENDFLNAHRFLVSELTDNAGSYRTDGVGIMQGGKVVHIAPPANRVPGLMKDLFNWLEKSTDHPLIKSTVFHYETEFIHPFSDGNGRIGRLWQTVILGSWNPLFYYLPVESVIRDNQTEYYKVLGESDKAGDSSLFIDFITTAIASALKEIVSDQVSDYVSDQVKSLIQVLGYDALSPADIMDKLSLSHRTNFRTHYLNPALEAGYIEMTVPDKPSSRNQKYRLTVAGRKLFDTITIDE